MGSYIIPFLISILVPIALSTGWIFALNKGGRCDIYGTLPGTFSFPDDNACHNINGTINGFFFNSFRANLHERGQASAYFYKSSDCSGNVGSRLTVADNTMHAVPKINFADSWTFTNACYCNERHNGACYDSHHPHPCRWLRCAGAVLPCGIACCAGGCSASPSCIACLGSSYETCKECL